MRTAIAASLLACCTVAAVAADPAPAPAKLPGLPAGSGYHSINPLLIANDAAAEIAFCVKAFGAKELFRVPAADGKRLMHAEVQIGDSVVMLMDEFPEMGCISAQTLGNSPVSLQMYVADVDASYKRAVEAGAKGVVEPQDMFWGDRYSTVVDPAGHVWAIITRKHELTPEQMRQAQQENDAKAAKPQAGEHAPVAKPKLEEH